MKLRLALLLLCLAAPLQAERLKFDHRLYPPLKAVLDSGDTNKIDFNNSDPRLLVDLIAIKGDSVRNWSEAFEIVSRTRPADVTTAKEWMAQLQSQAQARCPAQFLVLAEDEASVTFERRSPNCPAEQANFGIYRLVAGKRSWFELAVLVKGDLDPVARTQWLALLASAHLE